MSVWSPLKYGWSVLYWLRVEGVPVIWIERETTQTLPAGYTQDAALVVDRSSDVGQLVDRDTGLGTGFPLTWHLLDTTTVRSWLKRWAYEADLTADVTPTAATLNVLSTQNWPAVGTLWLGIERITYTGTTVVSALTVAFTGCTRGTGGSLPTAHYAGTQGGRATDLPRWWRGRQVRLFASPVDPSGYMTGTTLEAECEEVWRGHIDQGPHRMGNLWEFGAQSLDRVLDRPMVQPVTGKIIGNVARFPCNKADCLSVYLAGYDGLTAAAAKTWGFLVTVYPFVLNPDGTPFVDGTLLTTDEQGGRIQKAWPAARAAAPNEVGGLYDGDTYIGSIGFQALNNNNYKYRFTINLISAVGTLRVNWSRSINGVQLGAGPVWASPYSNQGWHDLDVVRYGKLLSNDFDTGLFSIGITVKLDDAADAVPATGTLTIAGGTPLFYVLSDVLTPGIAYFAAPTVDVDQYKNWFNVEGKTVEVGFVAAGSFATVMRRLLVSSGTSGLRDATYDTLGFGQGYGLEASIFGFLPVDESAVDIPSFASLAAGPLVDLKALVRGAGASFGEVFGGALALANRAVVARSDVNAFGFAAASRRVRLGLVATDAGGSAYTVTITDNDLLTGDGEPVQVIRRKDIPNVVTVQLMQGDGEGDKFIATDGDAVASQGTTEVTFTLPVSEKEGIAGAITQWTAGRFAANQNVQAIEVQCVPWVGNLEVGEVVRLVLTHYAIWQWSTGTPGYTGQGRVLGLRRRLVDGAVTATILIDGSASTPGLSPAAQVTTWSPLATPAAPATIDIPRRFYLHAATALTEAAGNIRLDHYQPGGGAEAGGGYYMISAAADTAGVCRLTVASVNGGASLSTSAASTLTLPATANASAFQVLFAHTSDGGVWA